MTWPAMFRTGTIVNDKTDPRHTGRVRATFRHATRVEWPNGWISDIRTENLEEAKE